jgi:hypothetical protein
MLTLLAGLNKPFPFPLLTTLKLDISFPMKCPKVRGTEKELNMIGSPRFPVRLMHVKSPQHGMRLAEATP